VSHKGRRLLQEEETMERDEGTSEKGKQNTGELSVPVEKKPWEEPKLAFVEPKLTKHGNLEKVTGQRDGFFGEFSP
jgi:hypothetical protein